MKAEAKRERTKMQFHVEFYETDEGKIPTVEFLDSLEDKMNAKKGKQVNEMTLQDYKKEKMKEPAFAKANEEIQPELNVIRAMIEARTSQNLTQKQLAEKTGIAQTEISRLENGTRNPSIKLLQRLAEGMDMVLDVSFRPKETVRGR